MSLMNNKNDKIRKTDIIIVLKPKEGTSPTNTLGLVDKRLFTRENDLHAKLDPQTCLWSLAYDNGTLPMPLKEKWTSWEMVHKAVKAYFIKRNIEIVEVID